MDTISVFEDAQKTFLDALAPAESSRFKNCSSAEDLLKSAQELEVIAKDRIRGRGFMSRIRSFNDSLAPYLGVIEVLISSRPEYTAIAWGSIRLVLQLASNYASFFDKLTQSLARLGHYLPQGQIIEQIYRSQHRQQFPEHVKNALCQVYVDIFEFLQNVARVFTKNDGKYKHRPRVAFGLAWKPFSARFDDILQQLGRNASILKDVVNLDQIQASVKEREEAAKEREAAEKERVAAEKERKAAELANAVSESEQKALLERFEMEEEEEARIEAIREQRAEKTLNEQKKLYAEVRQRLMDTEVLKESMERTEQKVNDLKLTIEEVRREEAIDRLRTWISPPQYMQEYEKALSERERGTADWLVQSQMFERWKTSATKSRFLTSFGDECLWVQGSPGYGKTVLAATVVDDLQYTTDDSVLYFFFRSGVASMQFSLSAYRSITAQILQHHRADHDVIDKFIFAMDQESGGQLAASRNELLELIRVYLQTPGRSYIIMDGVDECEDNNTLVQDLLLMRFESEAKVLFFSRPNVAKLLYAVPEDYHLLMGKKTATDIQLYLKRKVASLKDETLLPPSADVDNLVANLETGADGMFLWARLMIRYLSSLALSKPQRLKIIRDVTFPEGLEAMYDRIGALIETGFEVEKELARQVVIWLTFTKRQITTRELQEAVQSEDGDAEPGEEEKLSDFTQRVVMTCAGLVEIENMHDPVQGRSTDFFRFIHLSAKEYFSGEEGIQALHDKRHLSINPCQSNILITRTCLEYLTFALPAQPLGGDVGCTANQAQLVQAFPLSAYAASYWAENLAQVLLDPSVPIDDSDLGTREMFNSMLHSLSRFLGQELTLMAWIEALYICGHPSVSTHLDKWLYWAKSHPIPWADEVEVRNVIEDVKELSRYLRELHDFWGEKLVTNPECVWEEVVAFTPCRLLARTKAVQVHSLVSDPPGDDCLSTINLCKLSKASSNGLLVAVVSIWPSREYEDFARGKDKTLTYELLQKLSRGWVARYEVWSLVDQSQFVVDHRIGLDANEVLLQIVQSMCYQEDTENGGGRNWGMQFPLAISADVRMFTVLRSLYCVKPAMKQKGLIMESSTLNMAMSDGKTSPHWSLDKLEKLAKLKGPKAYVATQELELDERFKGESVYLYWLNFDPSSQYLLFVSQDLQQKSAAATFKIMHEPTLTTTALNHAELRAAGGLTLKPEWSRDFNMVKVAYHKDFPLLGFSFAGMLYLWPFKNASENPSPMCNIYTESDVAFSECGKHVLFREPLAGRSVSRPIAARFFQVPHLSITYDKSSSGAMTISWNKRRSWHSPSPSNRSRNLSPNFLPIQKKDAQQSRLTAVRSGNNEVYFQTQNDRETIFGDHRVKLPKWAESGKADIVVQAPTEHEKKIKMILNKAAKPWHGMADSVDRHLPAFVNIDPVFLDQHKLGDTVTSMSLLDVALADDGLSNVPPNVEENTSSFAQPTRVPEGSK